MTTIQKYLTWLFNWTLIWESKMSTQHGGVGYHTTIAPPHLPPLVTDWPYWKSISKNFIWSTITNICDAKQSSKIKPFKGKIIIKSHDLQISCTKPHTGNICINTLFKVHQACARACQRPITKKKTYLKWPTFFLAMFNTSTPNTDFFRPNVERPVP